MPTIADSSFTMVSDRYYYDFGVCQPKDGWAQIDTTQDASYYGTWANPITREFINYCEGDVTKAKSDTDEEFVAYLRMHIEWAYGNGYFVGIDTMCSPAITARFIELGFSDCFHVGDPDYRAPSTAIIDCTG